MVLALFLLELPTFLYKSRFLFSIWIHILQLGNTIPVEITIDRDAKCPVISGSHTEMGRCPIRCCSYRGPVPWVYKACTILE